ncbi:trk system potassium uptake protein TrkA [Aequitasia blattaphilus]|uniref:TrkA family potassium uptake protein n=1 Tax=Aequitasia blattaphilus TaxID=2949332 RepID=A0ABT1E850_9FIRM|nr:TrkA family potassium uptake protein [Aequitasia blattaphilus]MCP1101046.1 TrkA family potassium uptake protein [Aequitasia blattaphilus]MCR8613686.1 TrkA family potassium uptake protein [Aequitasia blattaphilus]
MKQYAVLGLGNFGESIALTLQELGCEVIAVDQSAERVQKIADQVSYAMRADIGDPEVIKVLGARNLDGVIVAVANNMEASILATIASKDLGVPYVLAKANNATHEKILTKIGADAVVYPERETGQRVARQLVSKNFSDWISLSPDYSIIETATPKGWIGKTLEELNIRENHDVSVIGFIKGSMVEVNPDPKKVIEEKSVIILMGANDALQEIQDGEEE